MYGHRYQGEANTRSQASLVSYSKCFPTMIEAWRKGFQKPDAYFGYIVLSTWCPANALLIPGMRNAQMAAQKLPKVGYATNADHGAGYNIHPPPKQYCGKRLANSALALQYNKTIAWKSPTFKSQVATGASVTVDLNDVSMGGLSDDTYPFNYLDGLTNCSALNAKTPGTCAWASLKVGNEWVNATITVKGAKVILTAVARSSVRRFDCRVRARFVRSRAHQ